MIMDFFKINMMMFIIAAFLLLFMGFLEQKFNTISKQLQIKPMRFYVFYLIFALLLGVLNFIAVEYFGSWKALMLTVLVVAVAIGVVFLVIKLRKGSAAQEQVKQDTAE